jgi:hypothetical protein
VNCHSEVSFSEIASWFWLLAVAGGALILGIGYAVVLLQRRRADGRVELSAEAVAPTPDAQARGRALRMPDIVSCIAGLWMLLSPWVVGGFGVPLTASNTTFGALVAILGLAAIYRAHSLEELVNAAIAVWVIASAWVLGPADAAAAIKWSNGVAGATVILCALVGIAGLSRPSGLVATQR